MTEAIVTIHDVARESGVSISTVSRVLNGYSNVKEQTRLKVLDAIDKLGFRPNSFAQTLITKRMRMIATIVPELTNEFYISVIKGIENVLLPHGYHQLIFSTENSKETELEIAKCMFVQMADGVILTPISADPSLYENFSDKLVLVDRYNPGILAGAVVVDNYGGSIEIVMKLVKSGHEKIALINGEDDFTASQDRKMGYFSALLQSGINIRADYICAGDWSESFGYQSMQKLMEMEDRPTAVFCASNNICIGAIKYLSDYNIKIGEDVSLVGFDDHSFADFVKPGITVVKRATVEMGECAADILVSMIENQNCGHVNQVKMLKTEIVDRGSIKRLK
ncbi:MAG: LacI family DNA-binding transcriptional regulator [Oscillospiraceae bacterium]